MKRSNFLFAVTLSACVIGTTARAQFTANPVLTVTTNVTALASIGNGFGVALVGYGLPDYNPRNGLGGGQNGSSNVLFLACPGGQPSAGDATVVGGSNQFYVVYTDFDGDTASNQCDLVAFKVCSPLSSPNNLTVYRTWVARCETNDVGRAQAASFAACGITTNGTIVLRADGTQSPHANDPQQAMFVFDANALSTVVVTDLLNNAALGSSCLLTQNGTVATLKIGQVGKNNGLLSANDFNLRQFVARLNITPTDANSLPHAQVIASEIDRSSLSINDASRVIAWWTKDTAEAGYGAGDLCSYLHVNYYIDNGTSIAPDTSRGDANSGSNVWNFGTVTSYGNCIVDHINTNSADRFGSTSFNGPTQISINDDGAMAFPVEINSYICNLASNGTRNGDVNGILYKEPNANTFKKVVDTSDTTLFAPIRSAISSVTNNMVSPPALDNKGNVFFEATLTNFVAGGTNIYDTAVYQSYPNTYPNPTSWTTRILLREGNTFVEPTSGHTIRIENLPMQTGAGTSSSDVPRALGANSINRTPFPGSGNQLGGVIVCATLTNLTAGLRYDGLLYIAPLPSTTPTVFQIKSITRSANNVVLVWNGWPGSNVVQVSSGVVGGSYSNNFTDLATNILSVYADSSYTAVGAATNIPSRYYRVRMIP